MSDWCSYVYDEDRDGRRRAYHVERHETEALAIARAYALLDSRGAGAWGRITGGPEWDLRISQSREARPENRRRRAV